MRPSATNAPSSFTIAYRGSRSLLYDFASGETRLLDARSYCGKGGPVPSGAATVLHLPLHAERELVSVRVGMYGIVMALLGITLGR